MNNNTQLHYYCSPDVNETESTNFLNCYEYYFKKYTIISVLEILLGLLTAVANSILAYRIVSYSNNMTIFDRLFLCHSIIDFSVGTTDLPFYHIFTVFSYWPFGKLACTLWSTLDNFFNTITIFLMAFMCWVRIKSIISPNNFQNDALTKQPFITVVVFCFVSVGIWLPINFVFIYQDSEYETGTCDIAYQPSYLKLIITFVTWFLPLMFTLCCTVYIIIKVRVKKKYNQQSSRKKTKRNLFDAESKLSIVIIIYLVQWLPSCILWMTNSLCLCISDIIMNSTYWLSFSVAFSDALAVLLLNSNYSFTGRKKNKNSKATTTVLNKF